LYIPEEKINEIKSRAPIVDVIGEYVHLKMSGKNYKGLCPFHSEKTPSFVVSPQKGIYHCFGCGVGGNVFNFLMKYKGIDFPEAVRLLGQKVGISIEAAAQEGERKSRTAILYTIMNETVVLYKKSLFSKSGEKALQYLKERRLAPDTIKKFHIGYAPDGWDNLLSRLNKMGFNSQLIEEAGLIVKNKKGTGYYDRFRNRVMFPIQDNIGRFIGFGGRIFDKSNVNVPKYINTNENTLFHKGRYLYGFYQAEESIRKQTHAFITEGYIDVIRMCEEGFSNTVAPLGTALTEEQISLIMRYTRNIYLLFDPDSAGIKAALRSTTLMHKNGIDPYIIRLPSGHDPGDFFNTYSSSDFHLLIKDRLSGIDFIIQHYIDAKKTYTANEKIIIIQSLSEYYHNMEDEIFREEFLHRASKALNTESTILEREIEKFTRSIVSQAHAIPTRPERNKRVKAELNLLLLILSNPDLFSIAETRLDGSYFHGKWTKRLWNTIYSVKDSKDWNASTVFTLLNDDKFAQYLSGRLIEDILSNHPKEALIDTVATIKKNKLEERMAVVNAQLEKAVLENNEALATKLNVEKYALRNELAKIDILRASKSHL